MSNATLPCPQRGLRHAADYHFGVLPGALKWCKIVSVRLLGIQVRLKPPHDAKKRPFVTPRVAKVAKKEPKRRQNGAKWSLKSHFFKKVQNVSSIHYLLYISHIGTSKKRHFSYPGEGKNKVRTVWCLQCRLGAAKW